MSTCPEKDIHSLYLDNELPKSYALKYEKHIDSCQKCKAELEKLKKTHEILRMDSNQISLDDEFLNESYDRLLNRMRYSKVIAKANAPKKLNFAKFTKYIPAAVAAATVFAIMLPLNINAKNNAYKQVANLAQIQAINMTSEISLNQNQLLSKDSHVAYPISLLDVSDKNKASSFSLDTFNPMLQVSDNHFHTRKIHSQRRRQRRYSNLFNYDVIIPELITENNSENMLQVSMPTYVDISSLNK